MTSSNNVLFQRDLHLHWGWLLTIGILFLIFGAAAISMATLTTLITVMFIGALILVSGILILLDTFKFWWGKGGGFVLHLIMSLVYVFVGIMLVQSPFAASISLTLFLGVFYLVIGGMRLIYAFIERLALKGWRILNALITLLIGILILSNWPAASLYIIGLFVGIDLMVVGIAYIMLALSYRNSMV